MVEGDIEAHIKGDLTTPHLFFLISRREASIIFNARNKTPSIRIAYAH